MRHASPECFVAHAPCGRSPCAVVYRACGEGRCDWWGGRDDGVDYRYAYLVLGRYYASREGAFHATRDGS